MHDILTLQRPNNYLAIQRFLQQSFDNIISNTTICPIVVDCSGLTNVPRYLQINARLLLIPKCFQHQLQTLAMPVYITYDVITHFRLSRIKKMHSPCFLVFVFVFVLLLRPRFPVYLIGVSRQIGCFLSLSLGPVQFGVRLC